MICYMWKKIKNTDPTNIIHVKVCEDVCLFLFYAKTTERIKMKLYSYITYTE